MVVQPTHVMNGDEYDKLRSLAEPFSGGFDHLAFGAPLLTATRDYHDVVDAMLERQPARPRTRPLVLMGHGTTHHTNAVYAALEYVFHDSGREDVHIGTVEGYPSFEEICRRLGEHPDVLNVVCAPLMVVAGDHAKNDLAGAEEDSWQSQLEKRGYAVAASWRGWGRTRPSAPFSSATPKRRLRSKQKESGTPSRFQ